MNIKVTDTFNKDIAKIRDNKLLISVKLLLVKIEEANSFSQIPKLKKIEGSQKHFRVRLGDYRMGIYFADNTIVVSRFLHRKEIYRYFP